jgi:tyrosine decarboxylase / aspartate 1-decarboxylase
MYWKKLSHEEIKKRIFDALQRNESYDHERILGIPGTYLDRETFYEDAPFLQDAPFLSTLIANPNHIGCHTLQPVSEKDLFKGTQEIEVDLIRLCAEQIFQGKENGQDGYVASGGTEANLEAMWIYRNYFMRVKNATKDSIAIVYSEDSHYSMPKAANLLGLRSIVLHVNDATRQISLQELQKQFTVARNEGIEHFIIVLNLSTTMFGSVDDIEFITGFLNTENYSYKLHVDAAFGGFIYPFANPDSSFNFKNPDISSITIDGHKMLQSPYGTGIFLIRKGLIENVCTEEAQYIPGKDYTVCGSRSGANAVALWMILMVHGAEGWKAKISQLLDKTSRLCSRLDKLGIKYYRNPSLNIVAIKSSFMSRRLAEKYHLVADSYEHSPQWYKIVIMPHVKQGLLDSFMIELEAELTLKT